MKVRSRPNPKRRRLVQIAVGSVLIIGVGLLLPRAFSVVAGVVVYPFHATNQWLNESSSLVPTFFRDRQSLLAEIEQLENDLVVARGANVTQQRLLDENERLRHLLAVDGEARVAAAVIARPNELPYDMLQIDRGAEHGIEVGSPVFAGNDVVIGLVVHTGATYSFVQLVTSTGFEAASFIAGPNIVATLEGFGSGVARVRVPQGIPLKVGNLVYLPSIEPGVFGRIAHVENEPTQPEQYGYITPDVAVASLFQVTVGKQSQIARSAEEIDASIQERIKQSLLVPGLTTAVATTSTSTAVTDVE